jgi:hypothetical protein
MTKLLEQAIRRLRALPDNQHDAAASLVMSLLSDDPSTVRLSPAQAAEVERRLAEETEYLRHTDVRTRFRHKSA